MLKFQHETLYVKDGCRKKCQLICFSSSPSTRKMLSYGHLSHRLKICIIFIFGRYLPQNNFSPSGHWNLQSARWLCKKPPDTSRQHSTSKEYQVLSYLMVICRFVESGWSESGSQSSEKKKPGSDLIFIQQQKTQKII